MRITQLTATTELEQTDYLAVDDETAGTRKILPEDLLGDFLEDKYVSYGIDTVTTEQQAHARSNIGVGLATTESEGLVQLYNGVDSTSTTMAATAAAVKLAYENGGGGGSGPITVYTSVTDLSLTIGSATISGIWSAMSSQSMLLCYISDLASGERPTSSGILQVYKKANIDGYILAFGREYSKCDYRMFLNSYGVPDGTWIRICGETTGDFVRNGNYTTAANNLIKFRRVGAVVTMHGSIYPTVQVPAYTSVGTIPDGFRPANNVSLLFIPSTQTESPYWVYAGTDGVCSMQSIALPANVSYYITATYIAK